MNARELKHMARLKNGREKLRNAEAAGRMRGRGTRSRGFHVKRITIGKEGVPNFTFLAAKGDGPPPSVNLVPSPEPFQGNTAQ